MSSDSGWDALHLLAEPTRRRVYEAVRAADEPITRDGVAEAVGIGRRLAAFHLDLLADAGLLDVDYARPPGRRRGRTSPGLWRQRRARQRDAARTRRASFGDSTSGRSSPGLLRHCRPALNRPDVLDVDWVGPQEGRPDMTLTRRTRVTVTA